MFKFFKKKHRIEKKAKNPNIETKLTAAVLAYEVARSDGEISKKELELLKNEISKIAVSVDKTDEQIFEIIEEFSENSVSFHEFIEDINKDYTKEKKLSLIKSLWDIAYADSILEVNEERLIRRIASLIKIKDIEVLKIKDISKNKN